MRKTVLLAAVGLAGIAWAGPFDKAELRGVTDKAPVGYAVGEPIDFTLTLTNADMPAGATPAGSRSRTAGPSTSGRRSPGPGSSAARRPSSTPRGRT